MGTSVIQKCPWLYSSINFCQICHAQPWAKNLQNQQLKRNVKIVLIAKEIVYCLINWNVSWAVAGIFSTYILHHWKGLIRGTHWGKIVTKEITVMLAECLVGWNLVGSSTHWNADSLVAFTTQEGFVFMKPKIAKTLFLKTQMFFFFQFPTPSKIGSHILCLRGQILSIYLEGSWVRIDGLNFL